jgi:hypothetical protein
MEVVARGLQIEASLGYVAGLYLKKQTTTKNSIFSLFFLVFQ